MNIKDYLHLYLGCEVMYSAFDSPHRLVISPHDDRAEISLYNAIALQVKPILRPLSDMTEESSEYILDEICEAIGIEPHLYYQAYGDILLLLNGNTEEVSLTIGANEMAEIVRTLCKHSIDIFGLIDAGLAIDKKTLK